jgi:hypothetical protein
MNETIKLLVVTGVLAVGGIGLLMYNNTEQQEQEKGKKRKQKTGGRRESDILSDSDDSLSDDSLSASDDSLSDDSLSAIDDDSLSDNEDDDKKSDSWLDLRSYMGNEEEPVKNKERKPRQTIKQKERNNKTKRKKQ